MRKIRKIILSLTCSIFIFFIVPEWTIAKNMANNECQTIYQLVLDEVYNGTEQVIICSDSDDAILETFLNMLFKGNKKKKIKEEWFSETICQNAKKDFFPQDKISFKANKEISDFLKGEKSIGKNIFYFTPVGFKNNEEALVGIGIVKNTNIIDKSSWIKGDTTKTIGYLAYLNKTKSVWQIKLFVRAWGQ